MPRVVLQGLHQEVAVGTGNITVPLPTHDVGDFLLVMAAVERGSSFSTPPGGWTKVGEYVGASNRVIVAYWKVAAASEADPAFGTTASSGARYNTATWVMKGVHATPIVIGFQGAAGSSDEDFNSPTATLTQANTMMVSLAMSNSHFVPYQADVKWAHPFMTSGYPDPLGDPPSFSGAYYVDPAASGTSKATRWINSYGAREYAAVVFGVRDDGTGEVDPQVSPDTAPATLVHALFNSNGSNMESGDLQSASENIGDPTAVVTTLPNPGGTATNYNTTNTNRSFFGPFYGAQGIDYPLHTAIRINSASDRFKPWLARTTLASAQDLSNSILSFSFATNQVMELARHVDGGAWLGLMGTTGANEFARVWQFAAADAAIDPNQGPASYQIDVNSTVNRSEFDSATSVDLTDIDRICWGLRARRSSGSVYGMWGMLYKLGTMILVAGSSVRPASFLDAVIHSNHQHRLSTFTAQRQAAVAQVLARQSLQIGDGGTNPIYFDATGQHLEYPAAVDVALRRYNNNVLAGAYGLTLYPGASDTITLDSVTCEMGNRHNLTLHASANSAATLSTAGLLLRNGNVEWNGNSAHVHTGITFLDCSEITHAGTMADFTGGCTFDGGYEAQQLTIASVAELAKIANCKFSNHARSILLTHSATSLSFPAGVTFTNVTKGLRYTGSDDLTLTVPASSNLTQALVEQGGTGTIDVVVQSDITINNVAVGDNYWVYDLDGGALVEQGTITSAGNKMVSTNLTNGTNVRVRVYRAGKIRDSADVVIASNAASVFPSFANDPHRVADDATALAYATMSISGATLTSTFTGAATHQQWYDHAKAWSGEVANLQYDVPVTSVNGVDYFQAAAGEITITGGSASLRDDLKTIDGTITVASGGAYEGRDGAKRGNGGTIEHFKRIRRAIVDDATSTAQADCVVSYWNGATELGYSTSFVLGGQATVGDGLTDRMVRWKVDAMPEATITEEILGYGFGVSTIPIDANGTQVGTAASPSQVRLGADANVSKNRADALAVSGVTTDDGTTTLDLGSNTYADVNDHVKAKQRNVAAMSDGTLGYRSYHTHGDLFAFDGAADHVLAAGWIATNATDTTARLKGGSSASEVRLTGSGTVDVDLNLNALTVRYMAAATYDHRGEDAVGTITLRTDGALTVTSQWDVAATLSNAEPGNITVVQNEAFPLTAPNLIDDTMVRWRNTTKGANLYIGAATGGSGASYSGTFGPGEEVENGDIIEMRACQQSGTSAKLPIVATQAAGSGGMSFIETQEDDTKHNTLGYDGELIDLDASPGTGEIKADFASVQIDANDPDGIFDSRKGIAWWRYITRTATGIDTYNPLALTYNPDVRNILIDGPLQIQNVHPTGLELRITEGLWTTTGGGSIIATGGTGNVVWVPNDRVYQGPETGISGLTAAESTKLLSIPTSQWTELLEGVHSAGDILRLLLANLKGEMTGPPPGTPGTVTTKSPVTPAKVRSQHAVDAQGYRSTPSTLDGAL